MEKPLHSTTRRGSRIYRHQFIHKGQRCFSDSYTYRVKRSGTKHYFNLGPSIEDARKRADLIAAFLKFPGNSVEDLFLHDEFKFLKKSRSIRKLDEIANPPPEEQKVPTIGEFCEAYQKAANHLSRKTIADNESSLRRIAAFVLGLAPLNLTKKGVLKGNVLSHWKSKVNSLPIDKITQDRLEDFKSWMVQRAGQDHLMKARLQTSANTYLRCASSMFSSRWSGAYRQFLMPATNPFASVRSFKESSHLYVSKIDPAALLAAARSELPARNQAAYVAFLLSLVCGMRRSEIDYLSWAQIDFEKRHIWIQTTPYFTPKACNSESRIDAPPIIFQALMELRAEGNPPPFVIPGSQNHAIRPRSRNVFRILIDWLRSQGVTDIKAMHTLRKEAGSLIYHQSGSVDVAAEFLRNDPRVAREHYIGRKGRLQVVIPGINLE